jgi:TonB family protein
MSAPVTSLFPPVRKYPQANTPGPRLGILWQKRRGHIAENLRALLGGPSAPKVFDEGEHFRGCHVKGRVPQRSLAASIVWHAVLAVVLIEFGAILLSGGPTQNFDNVELSWSGPVNDLPAISPTRNTKLPSPPGDREKSLTKRGADAFHPRQTIISAPKVPTHPRQTLIRPDAPPVAPKILPQLPNIVLWNGEPQDPRRNIASEKLLKQPKAKVQTAANVATPDLPNEEKNLSDISIASTTPQLVRPALTISSGHGTVAAPRTSNATASSAEPAPEFGTDMSNQRVIALSATPGPAAPPPPIPAGNVAARISISPDGPNPGAPTGPDKGASGNGGGAGNNRAVVVPGISVSGGDSAHPHSVSGVGNSNSAGNSPGSLRLEPGTGAKRDTPTEAPSNKPISERIKPGSPPEHIFGSRTVYMLSVNMPNLSSVSGSWILKFAEFDDESGSAPHPPIGVPLPARKGTLSGPQLLRKVDPQYPPEQVKEHIEGEVILYAVIRDDGSVDSIQVARKLDPVLDKTAMEALAEWKFKPAQRNGVAVPLEAIIHIPFRSTQRDY